MARVQALSPLQRRAWELNLSVSYPFLTTELRHHGWLNRWWPSVRLGVDPLQHVLIDDRYAPVSVANWKLIPSMARSMLARRVVRPLQFSSDRRLTVLIPFRDRQEHLDRLMPILTAKIEEQRLEYRIVVVEQESGGLFNRGKLLNVGMQYAAPFSDYYCLHDVDTIPMVANYQCPSQPIRLVNRIIEGQRPRFHNDYYFSGAISIRKDQAFAAHGFSNEYWGWGKEDDDFFFRLLLADYVCYFDTQGVFEDLPNPKHQQVRRNSVMTPSHVRTNRQRRSRLLRGLMEPATDGFNTLQYDIVAERRRESHTYLRVRLNAN